MAEDNGSRSKRARYYSKGNKAKHFIQPGLKGFMITCNFREKDCIREAYNILNQYVDKDDVCTHSDEEGQGDVNDISDQLTKAIDSAKTNIQVADKKKRFQVVETGASNCLFISTTLDNPVPFAMKIIQDIANTKRQETRYLLRLVPIEKVCRANISDITNTAGALFDQYFLKEPTTFAIVFNRRYNNSVNREDVIKTLADLIGQKNVLNKADLKSAKLCVIVEIIKGLCLLSVVPDYFQLKKFNLLELSQKPKEEPENVESSLEAKDEAVKT
ncbi:THUMP domain-containing protein 1 homolog [Ctenocephalides felis]|uniref:THUMP domain-containing protein 1 homolog n=1 Tax=Ctenocephalides felis TaxID=7515 RepID=UPI000E6E3930|nr:THUMP domain-containing protein 1 homolog [Ctenocephalides felis]XP_026465359.1 THUMP domain-containing protein 1 homolog [Ctenocephalides felis]XP_026465360.1 THUMP domain-containing protein 1 homolog [Ctenocephalides felis]XP_026465361.1 THUMP domain-containing protein 1 homolog [Ctenocephalides felis]